MNKFIATGIALLWAGTANADCNVADVLFGKVRIEIVQHEGYQTGIVFGADFDSKRFSYDRILGYIQSPERDGSRGVRDVNGEACARILKSLVMEPEETCEKCARATYRMQSLGKGYAILHPDGQILGTVQGALPK